MVQIREAKKPLVQTEADFGLVSGDGGVETCLSLEEEKGQNA